MDLRWLRLASWAETVSLLVLLGNLATVHVEQLASALGPLHGCAYLATIATAFSLPLPRQARTLTLVPGVGGLLALRRAAASSPAPPR
ncbi:DUF3817 domain-containing protein [Modestobacter versicolor]|uniref:DUF3817 domain-containing protein n=1 Tax=Modestobacter versicolor TaxID=429133 RepID=UPI0034DF0E5D